LPQAVYSYQMLSGKTGAENTFVLAGSKLSSVSDSGLGFFEDATCSGASFFRATVDEFESTSDGYVFTGTVPAIAPGVYTMCYCDDQSSEGNATNLTSKYMLVDFSADGSSSSP